MPLESHSQNQSCEKIPEDNTKAFPVGMPVGNKRECLSKRMQFPREGLQGSFALRF